MTDTIINQLHFGTNSKTILAFIKSGDPGSSAPPQFSMNSIRLTPEGLSLPLTPDIKQLAAMNVELPALDEATRQMTVSKLLYGYATRQSQTDIEAAIDKLSIALQASSVSDETAHKDALAAFDQAVSNYRESGFFCQYDWRMAHWGTVEDILSVTPSTFERPTAYLEFSTYLTPPVFALQALAQTFPSVKFKLLYRYETSDTWTNMEIFPITPFGY
jgi:hypothetical protein